MKRVAIVTGGAGGLGKAICKKLLEDGFAVYCCDMSEERGLSVENELKQYGEVFFRKHDVSSEDDWVRIIEGIMKDYGHIDCLVNNAGINIRVPIEDCSVEDWDTMFAVNVRSMFLGIKHCLPIFKKQHAGSIVNTSSVCGLVGHRYTNESYTATKGAVTMLTKSIATRYGKYNIRCNSVHPSTVDTPIVKKLFEDPARKQERIDEVPMGHLGKPEDIANAVSFLASDAASFINGVQLPVDGGTVAD